MLKTIFKNKFKGKLEFLVNGSLNRFYFVFCVLKFLNVYNVTVFFVEMFIGYYLYRYVEILRVVFLKGCILLMGILFIE